ncbi:MAG: hypothetical protein R2844_00570 [Caldilineales bacterium]
MTAKGRFVADLTRKEFYQLAHDCRDYAMRLATRDQNSVDRLACHEFNRFRERVAGYEQLGATAASLEKARPVTRLLVITATLGIWLICVLIATQFLAFLTAGLLLGLTTMLIFSVMMIPPRVYGTSVEAIEGRVLVVVEKLQAMLTADDLGFSEAAFLQVRDVLREANAELRQQVYLNRVDPRR